MNPQDFFSKKDYKFKLPPHLTDYQKTYDDFNWQEAAKEEISYFDGGKLNAAYNAVDRHLQTDRKNKKALLWEGDKGEKETYTFEELSKWSNKYGNYLKSLGVEKGDRVFLFLPRIPAVYFSFLGILKIGAIAGTLFSAFQEKALLDRLENSGAKVVITTKELLPRLVPLRKDLPELKTVVVVDDPQFLEQIKPVSDQLSVMPMEPTDYAFMLYTSGTTGKPKGIVHTHNAILSQHLTAKYILDIHNEDIYWCTADHGWVTGIAYGILGSLSCGVTSVVYSGRFDAAKWYEILQNYKVTIWYTAPTAIRMLMAGGDELVAKYDLSNLRHLLSVGEPLNPEAIRWGLKVYGLPFHDTWWQTETGSIIIGNYPTMDIKIGVMGKPFMGIHTGIVDDKGVEVPNKTEGNIAMKPGWPSQMAWVWNNDEKYKSYFENGWYISGDRGWKDDEGYFHFVGRADDVIKTSGERVGPFEVESSLIEFPGVVEAGVIGKPDALRGEIIKAFVVLSPELREKAKDEEFVKKLKDDLAMHVKKNLAGHAYPREVDFIDKLPKTRSGKIMRRILKAQEMGEPVGDTSTLEEY
ncbi:acetate--CoA ligase [Candidatus Gottesmanbacteria bacterium RIFCSPHIGHO2_02_FULL_39_11]|uniref:acetate--CoA ligase n=1 Tax=Candidatus Gottesmanbacteria bacterium RIFCSPHIGHO2_02_FULL_39_11 TaxID=1798382 RepID=A0A1F5ZPD8_9BACT|nr:MAG: acetate--CoA ligase [Candidatus Gottesmanbacteria bacterium RIFCSPHIGHO2_02_FULL_39_11]